ncbi:MAG: VCBS repeat-containing protein, partial [Thermoplasmata archaeon]|nr:VCBS repeat-containing protein [Thermoplasmata archaeon]
MQKQYGSPELKRHKPVSNILYSSFSIFIFFLFITQALLPIGSMNVRSHEPDDPISMGDPVDAPLQGDYPSVFWSDFNSPDISSKYYGVDFYDINLDGNLDMIAGSLNAIHIWTSDGSGNWAPYPSPPTLDYILFQSTASGDFNHDGKPDLVSTHSEGLCAWTGDANGNWTLSNSGLEAAKVLWMYDIILDDINLDGDLDIMVSGLGRPDRPRRRAISAFIGDGDGNWQSRSNSLTKEGTHYGIDLGDFNNDGMPDMVTANTMGVDAWVNADNGSWVLTDVGLPTSSEYSDAKFADFNNDGYLDIVATSNGNGGISVWNGNGNGIWTQNSDLPDIGYYTEVEVADLNHDGYMDIIASSRSTNDSIWTGGGMNDWYLQSN